MADWQLEGRSQIEIAEPGDLSAAVLDMARAQELSSRLRRSGRRIVFTNGCFDLLHRGHVDYLIRARGLGDVLFVGLNGDQSVRQLKGPGRPVQPAVDRAAVLAALRAVDVVVVFQELTAERVVRSICPHIYVKGGDWGQRGRIPPEAAIVEACGGRTVYLPYLPGWSTTQILEEIRGGSKPGPNDD